MVQSGYGANISQSSWVNQQLIGPVDRDFINDAFN